MRSRPRGPPLPSSSMLAGEIPTWMPLANPHNGLEEFKPARIQPDVATLIVSTVRFRKLAGPGTRTYVQYTSNRPLKTSQSDLCRNEPRVGTALAIPVPAACGRRRDYLPQIPAI